MRSYLPAPKLALHPITLLALLDGYPTNYILHIRLRARNGNMQPGEEPKSDAI